MRNRLMSVTVALLLASTVATAQTPSSTPTAPAPAPASDSPVVGTIDFGGLFGNANGDEARWERYRDTRDGLYTNIDFAKESANYFLELQASHIGYRDQKYFAGYDNKKVQFNFSFVSIPLNYMYGALSPWQRGSTTLSLDDNLQRQVENKTAVGVPCAPGAPPAACSSPAQAQLALANRSIYNTVPNLGFDMRSKRETLGLGMQYNLTRDSDIALNFTSTGKKGEQPWGASFAFNNANELPLPVDHRTNDFDLGWEWAKSKGMLRAYWTGSWFDNNNQVLVWDNPIRLTDYNSGGNPPWDASGYSNGNGPAQGRMSIWPSSKQFTFGTQGMAKLARATSVNGQLQFMDQEQNENLIPWTINNVINTFAPATFPGLRSLPRDTAEAKAKGLNALVNFTTRPFAYLGFQAKYRYNKRDVQTEEFDANEYVRFDAVPEDITNGENELFDVTRQTFDAAATASLVGYGAMRFGYTHEKYEREGRGFSDSNENTVKFSYDVMGWRYVSVRLGVDYGERRGDGYVLAGQDYETGPGGEQPGLRYYDEADRNRTRASVNISVNPTDMIALYGQYAYNKDKYLADDSVPSGREQMGLLNQKSDAWNVGASINPNAKVTVGLNYGQDKFDANQKSRNANPPPDPTWNDPARNWFLGNVEKVKNFNAYFDLNRAIEHVDLHFAYDYSDSDNALNFSGPRIASLAATAPGQFIPLPNVTNEWQRFTADLKYFFTQKIGMAVGYYYEKLDVYDYATIDANGSVGFTAATGTPRLDYLGEIMTGYGARPYDGQTATVRLLYRF